MDPTPTNPFAWALWFLGEVAFKWVPGAVAGVTNTSSSGVSPVSVSSPITSPVTAPQAVAYLQTASGPEGYDVLFRSWSAFVAFSMLISLCFIALIVYCIVRMFQIRQTERRKFAAAQHTIVSQDVPKTQLRWQRILEQANSDSEHQWRLAVLEADIMLNELLDTLGYRGETIADKMRGVERGNFRSIDLAWEAHRIRNQIAHEGSAYPLSQRETLRVVGLYEQVFREFRFVE